MGECSIRASQRNSGTSRTVVSWRTFLQFGRLDWTIISSRAEIAFWFACIVLVRTYQRKLQIITSYHGILSLGLCSTMQVMSCHIISRFLLKEIPRHQLLAFFSSLQYRQEACYLCSEENVVMEMYQTARLGSNVMLNKMQHAISYSKQEIFHQQKAANICLQILNDTHQSKTPSTNLHRTPLDLQLLRDRHDPQGTNIHGAWIRWLWNLGGNNNQVHMVQLGMSYYTLHSSNQECSQGSHLQTVHQCCCGMCLGGMQQGLWCLGGNSGQQDMDHFWDTLVLKRVLKCQLSLHRTILVYMGLQEQFVRSPVIERFIRILRIFILLIYFPIIIYELLSISDSIKRASSEKHFSVTVTPAYCSQKICIFQEQSNLSPFELYY